jgi:ribosomal protein S18 acetylase RimI-like enzyme
MLPGQATLLACWETLTHLSPGARLVHAPSATAAVFPLWAPLNNAILADAREDTAGVAAAQLSAVYQEAGVPVWALWVPSRQPDFDEPHTVRLVAGLRRDETTLVMHAPVSRELRRHDAVLPVSLDAVTRLAAEEPVPVAELGEPDNTGALRAWAVVHGDVAVACAYTFLHERDCGIYAVGTLPQWRRRGIGRALMEHVLADAARRGARTASLQSTPVGRGLYESVGFEAAGRYEEWISR